MVQVDRAGGGGGATELSFAQFANGDGIASELVFVNPSTEASGSLPIPLDAAIPASRPTVYFHDTEGNPIDPESVVELTGDLRITDDGGLTPRADMAPLGVIAISTHGQGELLSGSVRAVSDGPLGGFLRVVLPAVGVGVVGANPPVREAMFATRRQEGGVDMRVAIHNLESTRAVVRCDLMRRGTLLETADFLLLANGQMSRTVRELFPAAAATDFAGSVVRCVGTGRFTAAALETDPGTGTFTAVPAVKVDEAKVGEYAAGAQCRRGSSRRTAVRGPARGARVGRSAGGGAWRPVPVCTWRTRAGIGAPGCAGRAPSARSPASRRRGASRRWRRPRAIEFRAARGF